MIVYLPHATADLAVVLERMNGDELCGYLQRDDLLTPCFWTYDAARDQLELDWDEDAHAWTLDVAEIYDALHFALNSTDAPAEAGPHWFVKALLRSRQLTAAPTGRQR